MNQPRCSKCKRPLSNLDSIARGMGPVCAGLIGRSKGRPGVKSGRFPRRYATGISLGQLPLFVFADLPQPKKMTKRQSAREARAYRKSLFENRQPFSLEVVSSSGAAIIYTPVGGDMWEDNTGERYSHQYLADYLRRSKFI